MCDQKWDERLKMMGNLVGETLKAQAFVGA